MGSIKLPHASGNSMSIAAPATNPASDLELKLPATIGTAGQYLTVDGSGNLVWADPPGITEMDQWRLTTNFTVTGNASTDLNSDWERNDTGFTKIGTGMTESSGVFTFPSTGIWQIDFTGYTFDTDHNRYTGAMVKYSSDSGSNWIDLAYNLDSVHNEGSDTVYGAYRSHGILDVTNESNFRVKFTIQTSSNAQVGGSTSTTRTNVVFMRLGAT